MKDNGAKHGLRNFFQRVATGFLRILTAIFVPAVTFYVLYRGFIFLRNSDAPIALLTVVAIIWGVGGVACLYFVANWLISQLPERWSGRLQPFLFVGPAVLILGWYLALPAIRSLYLSLFGPNGKQFVGLLNYLWPMLKLVMSLMRSIQF